MATRKKSEQVKEAEGGESLQQAPKPQTPSKKIGKLLKKDKHRLPRKEKKLAKKRLLSAAP